MLAVMGATGKTGGAVLAEAKQRGVPVRGLTRRPARAGSAAGGGELVRADPADADSLAAAFAGCTVAYVMIPPFVGAADVLAAGKATAEAIGRAVDRAGVAHVVALSSGGVHLAEGMGRSARCATWRRPCSGPGPG